MLHPNFPRCLALWTRVRFVLYFTGADVAQCPYTVEQTRHPTLRFSVPPYYVGMVEGELPILSFPGEVYSGLERSLAPSAEDVRRMLLQLRSQLRWPRSALAAYLGVSRDAVRRWETGERNPSGAARRLIWLLNLLGTSP